MSEIIRIPLAKIALTAEQRIIRQVHDAWVHELTETDPETWDPLWLRAWPANETPPRADVEYEIIGGNHRWSAARAMNVTDLRAQVYDAPTDQRFYILAYQNNARHGQKMEHSERVATLKRLQIGPPEMSLGDLSRETGVPKATLNNWLTSRDTNAARSSHNATDELRSQQQSESAHETWLVNATANASTRLLRATRVCLTNHGSNQRTMEASTSIAR